MRRIKHFSVPPAIETALVESLGVACQRPRHRSVRSTVVLVVGLLAACAAFAAVLVYLTCR